MPHSGFARGAFGGAVEASGASLPIGTFGSVGDVSPSYAPQLRPLHVTASFWASSTEQAAAMLTPMSSANDSRHKRGLVTGT